MSEQDMRSPTGIVALSHINVVVEDVDRAAEFYARTLGFIQATNDDGVMDYEVRSDEFRHDAGFEHPVNLRIRFLRHPVAGIFLELMQYRVPADGLRLERGRPHDLGGLRHIAFEVANLSETFRFLSTQPDVQIIGFRNGSTHPKPLPSDYTISFFYWVDPWGVCWEMEGGRPVGDVRGVIG